MLKEDFSDPASVRVYAAFTGVEFLQRLISECRGYSQLSDFVVKIRIGSDFYCVINGVFHGADGWHQHKCLDTIIGISNAGMVSRVLSLEMSVRN